MCRGTYKRTDRESVIENVDSVVVLILAQSSSSSIDSAADACTMFYHQV